MKIVNLKDYRFDSLDQVGNFNPADPYSGSQTHSYWSIGEHRYDNIKGVEDYSALKMVDALNPSAISGVSVADANAAFAEVQMDSFESRFNRALEQYNSLINDSSYKGINLLSGNSLSVTFNETRDSKYTVSVGDISSMQLGLNPALWETMDDVLTSMNEVSAAINKLRSVASDLGTSYTIIQTRQNFTENLINVLQEGADNLTLADMNEESANMLALQTRQMLGVNSLSLAAQAAQSVLQLF